MGQDAASSDPLSPQEAMHTILDLLHQGLTTDQIKADHPELEQGWKPFKTACQLGRDDKDDGAKQTPTPAPARASGPARPADRSQPALI